MENRNQNQNTVFVWRIAASHVLAYFIAGIFAVYFMNYKEHYASQYMSLLMLPVDSPMVALGPSLQIFRGIIIALVLIPFKNIILNDRFGILKMAGLIFGLSFISTIGPTPGSFEGYIYTILPLQYHLLGIPETILYISLFSVFIGGWYKYNKPVINILSIIFTLLIVLMSVMGYLKAVGLLKVPN